MYLDPNSCFISLHKFHYCAARITTPDTIPSCLGPVPRDTQLKRDLSAVVPAEIPVKRRCACRRSAYRCVYAEVQAEVLCGSADVPSWCADVRSSLYCCQELYCADVHCSAQMCAHKKQTDELS